ncbi:unnamed protein product [Caenorhabditis auriculariae]|uniref:Uncharacterized protein n=1 Tax=Caenorhabditis auriculariae TaxID=2777116 RepID=A0A8S1HHZ3_9PELO|nr:unnamed protein product [Caenorhabditis auriculariae]
MTRRKRSSFKGAVLGDFALFGCFRTRANKVAIMSQVEIHCALLQMFKDWKSIMGRPRGRGRRSVKERSRPELEGLADTVNAAAAEGASQTVAQYSSACISTTSSRVCL